MGIKGDLQRWILLTEILVQNSTGGGNPNPSQCWRFCRRNPGWGPFRLAISYSHTCPPFTCWGGRRAESPPGLQDAILTAAIKLPATTPYDSLFAPADTLKHAAARRLTLAVAPSHCVLHASPPAPHAAHAESSSRKHSDSAHLVVDFHNTSNYQVMLHANTIQTRFLRKQAVWDQPAAHAVMLQMYLQLPSSVVLPGA